MDGKESKVNAAQEGGLHEAVQEGEEGRIKELESLLKHLQADFENYRKYVEKERGELALRHTAAAIQKLLPALDEFDITLQHAPKSTKEELEKAMGMVRSNLIKTLQREGLKEIEALHQKFDPFLHEAIRYEESDVDEGKISQVLKKGYLFKNHVLRHALVIVSSGKKKGKEEGKQ